MVLSPSLTGAYTLDRLWSMREKNCAFFGGGLFFVDSVDFVDFVVDFVDIKLRMEQAMTLLSGVSTWQHPLRPSVAANIAARAAANRCTLPPVEQFRNISVATNNSVSCKSYCGGMSNVTLCTVTGGTHAWLAMPHSVVQPALGLDALHLTCSPTSTRQCTMLRYWGCWHLPTCRKWKLCCAEDVGIPTCLEWI
jgi:hypothetical protein